MDFPQLVKPVTYGDYDAKNCSSKAGTGAGRFETDSRYVHQEHRVHPKYDGDLRAGGCFWGMQDLFRRQAGVLSTRVGYTGDDVPNATYRNHGTHAEAIEIVFDPQRVRYWRLLEFFFHIDDPTTLNRQGNDHRASYRSAIFYTSDEQKRIANDTIADVDASGLWPGKVVTEVTRAGTFWEAEPENQDYLEHYPNGYTCDCVRPDHTKPQQAKTENYRQRSILREALRFGCE